MGRNKDTYKGNPGHQQRGNECSENAPLGPIVETVPSENIEIAGPVHVTGIDLPSECIDEIVIHKHLVPCADEIYGDIIGDLEVSVHSKETLERAVDRVVERDGIKTIIWSVSQEVLIIGGCQICSSKETGRQLGGSSTATTGKILEGFMILKEELTDTKIRRYSHQ